MRDYLRCAVAIIDIALVLFSIYVLPFIAMGAVVWLAFFG